VAVVNQLVDGFPGVAIRIVMVGILLSFFLASLLAALA